MHITFAGCLSLEANKYAVISLGLWNGATRDLRDESYGDEVIGYGTGIELDQVCSAAFS